MRSVVVLRFTLVLSRSSRSSKEERSDGEEEKEGEVVDKLGEVKVEDDQGDDSDEDVDDDLEICGAIIVQRENAKGDETH